MLKIRYVQPSDLQDVYTLSNDTVVRLNSINKEHIEWESHVRWFNEKLNSKDTVFYILEYDCDFAGYCRLDKDREKNFWVITIHLGSKYRHKGFGAFFISNVCQKNSDKNIISYIKYGNLASYKLFINSKFVFKKFVFFNNEKYYLMEMH